MTTTAHPPLAPSHKARGLAGLAAYTDMLANFVRKDIRVRYQGAALGFLWSLINPAVMIGLYIFVFSDVFRSNLPHYPLYLMAGLLHWNLFSQITGQSCDTLIANAGLVKKIYFPRLLVPISSVLFNVVLWLLAILLLFALYPFLGGKVHLTLLAYPLALLLFLAFTFGITLILSVLNVLFRDLKHLVDVTLLFLFWVTPIVYQFHRIPPHLREWFALSPLVEYTLIFRGIIYSGQLPSVHIMGAALLWTAASLGVGLWIFHHHADNLVERL
ncbi:MAG: ABC transporter permease [Gammaproteobacteria bacterium]|nr:ABC transporter permease [Gammaproteobacteria bacterium]